MVKPHSLQEEGARRERRSLQHPREALWVLMRPVGIDFLKSHLLEMDRLRCDEEPYERKPQIKFSLPDEVRRTDHKWNPSVLILFKMGQGQMRNSSPQPLLHLSLPKG